MIRSRRKRFRGLGCLASLVRFAAGFCADLCYNRSIMEFKELIEARRSVRKYVASEISEPEVEAIVSEA